MGEELTRNTGTLQAYVKQETVVKRFEEVLGPKQTPIFLSALIAYGSKDQLKNCEPQSIITSAMQSVVLDLPLALGFSHIVPYGNKAQFQVAARGYVELAKRTGQYRDINVEAVNTGMLKGYNDIGSPILDWTEFDASLPAIGYMAGFVEQNGAIKVVYWSKERVLAHAKQYSRAYQYDLSAGKKLSKWSTDFDAMAKKTVLKNLLTKWAMLSIQMKQAMDADQAVIGEDGEPVYVDNADDQIPGTEVPTGSRTDQAAANLKRRGKPTGSTNKPKETAGTAQPPQRAAPPVQEPKKTVEGDAEDVTTPPEGVQEAATGTETTETGGFF